MAYDADGDGFVDRYSYTDKGGVKHTFVNKQDDGSANFEGKNGINLGLGNRDAGFNFLY